MHPSTLFAFVLPRNPPEPADPAAPWNVSQLQLLPAGIVIVVLLALIAALVISGAGRNDEQQQ